MRKYAVMFDAETALYYIIFRDPEDPMDKWYRQAEYAGAEDEAFTTRIVEALNRQGE